MKNKPRTDLPKGNALRRARLAAGLTQDSAIAVYRTLIGPVSRRTWQYWEALKKDTAIPPGAMLIFKK